MLYLIAVAGGLVFYWAYREWLSWVFLLLLVLTPLFSLLCSLPAMLTCRTRFQTPDSVASGTEVELQWEGSSPFPMPAVSGKVTVHNTLTGQRLRLRSGDLLPTDHCGLLALQLRKPRCQDYLGLFALPVGKGQTAFMTVRPQPLPMTRIPDLTRYQACAWVPKPGGGFSENHELRLYRPGDDLRQVHWKLSAKTGKLIYRESMEAVRSRMLLTLELSGTPQQLDRKLGRLLWLSDHLLESQLSHTVQCLTAEGVKTFSVTQPGHIHAAVDALLRLPVAQEGQLATYDRALWHFSIGGEPDEG
jgi:hypothetical protein